MMLRLGRLLIFLLVLTTALALICKRCSNNEPECKEVEDETCPAPTANSPKEPACLTHIYKDAKGEKVVEKKCVLKDKNKAYECVPLPTTTEVECVTCLKDRCNSGMRFTISSLAVIAASLLVLLS